MGRELELKLEIEAKHADKLRALPMLAGTPRVERLTSTYFDTPKGKLRRNGWVLRVRRHGDAWIQTVKNAGDGAGLFAREEWEADVAGPEPDLRAIAASPLKELIKPHQFRHLVPIFRTEVERTSWQLRSRGAVIELSLDEGEIHAGDESAHLGELELELKEGGATALVSMARRLARHVPARLGMQSKSERGFALARGKRISAAKATPVSLRADASIATGLGAIVSACLKHYRLNEPLLVKERDSEALHQLRVAVRRLRTALWLFKPVAKDEEFAGFSDQLRIFTRELGAARNIDVILATLAEQDPVRGQLEKDRDLLYGRIIRKFGGRKLRNLGLELLAWAHFGEWRRTSKADKSLMPFALKRLDRLWSNIDQPPGNLSDLSAVERHRLRIMSKKLRYALEFLSEPLDGCGKPQQKFIDAAEGLQDSLGLLNDLTTRQELLGPLPVPPARLGALYLRDARRNLREMRKIGPFWREAEA